MNKKIITAKYMNYIFITEDQEVYKCEEFTDDDVKSCDVGILDVIRVSDLKRYFEGQWYDLKTFE